MKAIWRYGIKIVKNCGDQDFMNKQDLPLVSVIIPTYNRVEKLSLSVPSVLSQTYSNLEVIVADDGSDDGTEEYVKALADSRIKYIRNPINKGPSSARNLGAGLASGEYLAFHDSDDEWVKDKLEKQMDFLLNNEEEIPLVYCEFAIYIQGKARAIVPSREIPKDQKQGNIFPFLLLRPLIGTPTIVVKKKHFFEVGGFDEAITAYEDYEFTLRFSKTYKIGFVEEPLVRIYNSPNGVNKNYDARIRAQFYMVREMFDSYKEKGLLWVKLCRVLQEAWGRGCNDVFAEEVMGLSDLLLTEKERYNGELLFKRAEKSNQIENQVKLDVYEGMRSLKKRLLEIYSGIYQDTRVWNVSTIKSLEEMEADLQKVLNTFSVLKEFRDDCEKLKNKENLIEKTDRLIWLAKFYTILEEMEKVVGRQLHECNVCGCEVFFNDNGKCPVCKATPEERKVIAILEERRGEENGKLELLDGMFSDVIECYVLGREDIRYETEEFTAPG